MTPRASRRWSITRRLTIAYASSAFVLVACAVWLQYRSLAHDLASEDDQLLLETFSAAARDVGPRHAALVAPGSSTRDALPASSRGDALARWQFPGVPDGPIVRLLTSACEPVGSGVSPVTARAGAAPLPPAQCGAAITGSPRLRSWTSPMGDEWRVAAARLSDGSILEILLDRRTDAAVLARSRAQLAVLLFLVLVVAGVLGSLIARRGLAPITRLAARVSTIDERSLDQRVALAGAPEEVRELALSFDAMLARLEQAFAALSERSAELAHEIRTPLHVLHQRIEVALTRVRSPEEYREVLGTSLEELGQVQQMADAILFLARAEDPRLVVQREQLDASMELRAVAEFMEALAEEHGVTITVDAPSGIHFVGDRSLIRRALVNLVSNALAHTPADGAIRLGAMATPVRISLAISDTGCGIDPDALPRVFDRYYRAPGSASGARDTLAGGGAGLGLAIVRTIAHLHGGTAHADNLTGGGATIRLDLPRTVPTGPTGVADLSKL